MNTNFNINKTPKILVVGDFILDQYYWSDVSQISPEAPVPVCHVTSTTSSLGGAGNVANNLAVFGSNVHVAGVMGSDLNGNIVLDKFNALNINTDLLVESDDFPTICKTRVIAKGQQLCRLDFENTDSPMESLIDSIIQRLQSNAFDYDAIALSDYNKGTVTAPLAQRIINQATDANIPVIVDPKGFQSTKYNGATFITPNTNEFKDLTGLNHLDDENEIINHAKQLLEKNNLKYIAFTRSEKGITLVTKSEVANFATKVIDVSDVTGAGDTVVAAIAFGSAQGWSMDTIMSFANLAAGVVVSKVGTATATLAEIKNHGQHF